MENEIILTCRVNCLYYIRFVDYDGQYKTIQCEYTSRNARPRFCAAQVKIKFIFLFVVCFINSYLKIDALHDEQKQKKVIKHFKKSEPLFITSRPEKVTQYTPVHKVL